YLRGEVRLNEVKGVHGTIFTDKNIASCADKIASALTEAQRRASAAKTAS
ncbi:MAG: hypothetical protein JO317_00075, partial [Verrucomicrobiae bacterium]|nr:hypothetical protein [Verrucomicrobiae bacterium]